VSAAALVRTRVLDWLDDNFHFGEAEQLVGDDERSFLENGILDSLGFVQLVLFLEDSYGLRIEREALTPDNFDSLGKIVRYVVAHPGFRGEP
jgi:acyl carrier protein